MPNKRSDDKQYLSAWIDQDLKAELKEMAKERGVSLTDLVNEVMREAAKHRKDVSGGK